MGVFKWNSDQNSRRTKKTILQSSKFSDFFYSTIQSSSDTISGKKQKTASQEVQKTASKSAKFQTPVRMRRNVSKHVFLHVFGQKSGLGQSWDMSRNDGHMLYQVGPLQKAEKIH